MNSTTVGVLNPTIAAFGALWDGGAVFEGRTGGIPASPADAPTGTLLFSMTLPADPFAAAAGAAVAIQGVWEDTAADAAGTVGYCRLRLSGDPGTGGQDAQARVDFTAGQGAGEVDFDNATLQVGQRVVINSGSVSLA